LQSKADQRQTQPDLPHQSSKRSFFRRKNKSKNPSIGSHPPVVVQHYRHAPRMNSNDRLVPESLGTQALGDPSLGLQESDVECWALSMPPEVMSRLKLDDKEVKRQEHM